MDTGNGFTPDKRLDALYARLPKFSCRKGCHSCCGPVMGLRLEADRLPFTAPVGRLQNGLTCGFWNCGCTIYANRPLICRLFGVGHDRRMQCPHSGHSPVGPVRLLTAAEEKAVLAEYFDIGRTDAKARGLAENGQARFFRTDDEGEPNVNVD